MAGLDPTCYMCGKYLPHTPGVKGPNLCACGTKSDDSHREPELHHIESSEITAMVDPSGIDTDNVCRPIEIGHIDGSYVNVTVADARRLLEFLNEAIPYLETRVLEH